MSCLSGEYSERQVGKFVVGAKERSSKKVKARVISDRERETLHGFIAENVETGTLIYTDDFKDYRQLANYCHQFVKHGAGEYVNEMAYTNGLESFWAMLKRAHKGTYHKMSVNKHLRRYVPALAASPEKTRCPTRLLHPLGRAARVPVLP